MLEISIQLPRDRFSLQVEESLDTGAIWAIMGPSGCGKTSLLRALSGLESRARGRITFQGEVWQDTGRGVWVPPRQRGIGYIFQEARLFPHLDVMGNLEFARRRARPSGKAPEFSEVVEPLGIEPLLGRGVARLSGGEKQRVAIARTLLSAPRVLLMDEPLASLDWASKVSILPRLRDIQRHFQIPIIMVSHAREEVARLADQLLLINHGQVVDRGFCRDLMSRAGSPLANDDQALSVLEAQVIRHDPDYPLTELQLDDQTLVVNRLSVQKGEWVRVVLSAHEVSIVLDDISCTSVQNRLSVRIQWIRELGSHHVLLSLAFERQQMLALITRKSLKGLGLSVGQTVYAHFKAACLDVV